MQFLPSRSTQSPWKNGVHSLWPLKEVESAEGRVYKVWWPCGRKRRSFSAMFGLGWEPDAEKVLVAGESHLRNSDKQLLIT